MGSEVERKKHYEYLIYCEVILFDFRTECENWIHVDGIQLERDNLRSRGIIDHPAFEINCVTDLYCKFSNPVEEDEVPNINDLK